MSIEAEVLPIAVWLVMETQSVNHLQGAPLQQLAPEYGPARKMLLIA
jgi:hypothetical protein